MSCVCALLADELFVGVATEAAYCNGHLMHASDTSSLDKAMVITDVGYERSVQGARRLTACQEALLLANVFGVSEAASHRPPSSPPALT